MSTVTNDEGALRDSTGELPPHPPIAPEYAGTIRWATRSSVRPRKAVKQRPRWLAFLVRLVS